MPKSRLRKLPGGRRRKPLPPASPRTAAKRKQRERADNAHRAHVKHEKAWRNGEDVAKPIWLNQKARRTPL